MVPVPGVADHWKLSTIPVESRTPSPESNAPNSSQIVEPGVTFTCAAGTGDLTGTGFEGHAGTSWLQTQANVTPGSTIWLEFGAFDSGDGVLDSTGIVDNFQWSATPGTGTMTHKP